MSHALSSCTGHHPKNSQSCCSHVWWGCPPKREARRVVKDHVKSAKVPRQCQPLRLYARGLLSRYAMAFVKRTVSSRNSPSAWLHGPHNTPRTLFVVWS